MKSPSCVKGKNKIWKKIAAMALAVMLVVGLSPGIINAVAATGTATIPISQKVVNGSGTFNYTLTPITTEGDQNHPMPAGYTTENGKPVYKFSINGSTDTTVDISSSTPGTWYYTLTAADADSTSYSYDVKTYRVGVKIYNDNGELKGEVNAIATNPRAAQKATSVHFTITYPDTPTPTPNPPTPTPEPEPTPTPTPTSVTVNPSVQKTITGDTPSTASTFQFTLTPVNSASSAAMPSGTSNGSKMITINGAGNASFGSITFTAPGTYSYDVSEVNSGSTGYTYDAHTYRITYVVTSNGTSLVAAKTVYDGSSVVQNNSETAAFTNTYKAPTEQPGVGDPSITKVIQATRTDSAGNAILPETTDDFHFTLEPYNSSDRDTYPMPAGSSNGRISVTTHGAGNAEFGNINFTSAGTYNYRVTEQQESTSGYTYDATVFRIQYDVTKSGNAYNVERTVYRVDSGRDTRVSTGSDDVTFTNNYTAPTPTPGSTESASVNPTVVKRISGDEPSSDTTFRFTLTAADRTSRSYMPDGSSDGSKTVTINGAGKNNFGEISFDKAGTYSYNVTEVKGNSTGYTYDKHTYKIVYTVSQSGSRYMATENVYEGEDVTTSNSDTVTFTNRYSEPEVQNKTGVGDPSITKVIKSTRKDSTGKAIEPTKAVDFHFTLSPFNSADKDTYPMPDGSKDGSKTVNTIGQEKAEFGDIEFESTGTYTYRVTERKEDADGYTYDETIYKIVYEVTEGSGDEYDVERTLYRVEDVNGSNQDTMVARDSDDATFTNEYAAPTNKPNSPSNPSNPSNPSSTTPTKSNGSTSGTKSVKTGDVSNIGMYFGMMVSAAAVLILLGAWRGRNKDEEEA